MKSTLHTFPALLFLGIYIYFTDCQYIPNRCACTKYKNGVVSPVSDFTVNFRRPGCTRDEIIIILKNNKKVCLTPHGPQGKRLLKCLHRKREEGKNEKTCIGRLKPRRRHKQRS